MIREDDAYYGEPKKPIIIDEAQRIIAHRDRITSAAAALVQMGIIVQIGAQVLRNVDVNVQVTGQCRQGKSAAAIEYHSSRRLAKNGEMRRCQTNNRRK